jgi:hypothetical protein
LLCDHDNITEHRFSIKKKKKKINEILYFRK